MNSVALVGRLTKNPIVTYTQGGSSITKFSIAVDRRFKTDGQPSADFINVVVFCKTGEFVEKWFHKGDPISITGRIQTGSYTKQDGTKVYTTDVIAESAEFVPGKPQQPQEPERVNEGFMQINAEDEAGLPF
jgi:single-strand DNA-binding protein